MKRLRGLLACPRCGGETVAVNVRGRKTGLVIWRQRRCGKCGRSMASYESWQKPGPELKSLEKALLAALKQIGWRPV